SVQIAPGKNRPFVIDNLGKFREPSGEAATPGTYRFELTYTDGNESFEYSSTVYSAQFDLAAKLSRR
ncbi:MAG: hypothetical protein WBM74_14510, partial [Polyangiales bacterium]